MAEKIDNVDTNLELKKTVKIEDDFYNINAVYSDEAGKVTQKLTLTPSLEIDPELTTTKDLTGAYDGSAEKEVLYVPATGGAFNGPVHLDNNHDSYLGGVQDSEIVNLGQMKAVITRLKGAPLYAWDADNGTFTAIKSTSNALYQLNTVIGKTSDITAFEYYSEGGKIDRYLQQENDRGNEIDGHVNYENGIENDIEIGIATGLKNSVTDIAVQGTYGSSSTYVKIKEGAFAETALEWVHINSGVTEIGSSAFEYCDCLEYITIPDSITSIGEKAFHWCSSLSEINLSRNITEIKSKTFSHSGLEKITIGHKVTQIALDAFENCASLKDIYFTGTETDWTNINNGNNPLETLIEQQDITVHFGNMPFPFLYICDDGESDTSLTSNKMFLKLPGEAAVEIAKGAVRLNSPNVTQNYYTYEGLAEIIARINKRLDGLGVKVDNTNIPSAPLLTLSEVNSLVPDIEVKEVFNPDDVATVQQLQDQIKNVTGQDYTYKTYDEEDNVERDYPDTVLKAKSDSDGREIKTGYYQSRNDKPKYANNATIADDKTVTTADKTNTITILKQLPYDPADPTNTSKTLAGNIGDICIVIKA